MSFKSKDLNVLAYANGFTMWGYVTTDQHSEVLDDEDYWSDARDMVRDGDFVFVKGSGFNTTGHFTFDNLTLTLT